MALGVALAGLVFENIGRFAGNRIQFEIVAVFDFIVLYGHPLKYCNKTGNLAI
ncbi:MAG: hypothetical protein AB2720_04165 [Candidatus Thiodiazotropha taylori]